MKRNYFVAVLMFSVSLGFHSCEWDDDTNPPVEIEEKSPFFQWDPEDADDGGNLLMINASNQRLVLYKGETAIRQIPASSSDYLINIPNEQEGNVDLSLYKWEDVEGSIDLPPLDKVFKKWIVPLSNATSIDKRVTWHVSSSDQHIEIAMVSFNYYGGTPDNADVYINGYAGAKIMSLKPGDQYKKVGLDYGTYSLHYKYWKSNQNSTDGMEIVGERDKQTIMGKEKNIWLVLNANRQEETVIIPHYGAVQAQKFGNIKISNVSGDIVQVYVGTSLIEHVCYLESESVKNLSTLNHSDSYEFTMPITVEDTNRQEYIFVVKNSLSQNTLEELTTIIVADSTINWLIDGDNTTK
jgi:hypothetical protein